MFEKSRRPIKNIVIPKKQNTSAIRFLFSNFVFKNSGSRISKYIGAENCKKIALAAVVSFVAITNKTNISEYVRLHRIEIISISNLRFTFRISEITIIVTAAIAER